MTLSEDELKQWESSANNMQMQGDVHEQGYAERILALIQAVREANAEVRRLQSYYELENKWRLLSTERLASAEEALRFYADGPNTMIMWHVDDLEKARAHFAKWDKPTGGES